VRAGRLTRCKKHRGQAFADVRTEAAHQGVPLIHTITPPSALNRDLSRADLRLGKAERFCTVTFVTKTAARGFVIYASFPSPDAGVEAEASTMLAPKR